MTIYFVRHGHPDYKNDCLTELGKKQAQKAAERLRDSGIETIYASTKGRAMETAEYTARELGLDVVSCDFMREIGWGPIGDEELPEGGHPWKLARSLAAEGISITNPDWREMEPFCRSVLGERVDTVVDGFDALMAELGYQREGDYYRVCGENTDKTVAIFSHGGSSTAVLAHLLNVPFLHACGFIHVEFTSITVIRLPNTPGELVIPKLIGANDVKHLKDVTVENVYGN